MKPAPFDYLRAMTTQDALDALAETEIGRASCRERVCAIV